MAVEPTFFWYDLETTGISPRDGRIMQFAGQRTNMNLQPVGEPTNVLVRLSNDILPDPDAIMITGITPQSTIADGLTEVEFLELFHEQVATPGTIFAGYNTVRFDDEFMRFLHYRNFYDAYEWQWKDERSRWDLLDVVRMTRALRPDGIEWPVVDGKPTNRLELITKLNGLDHEHAHDALNDVLASIAVAQLLRDKQPKLFDWLLSIRDKRKAMTVVQGGEPFVYSSSKYANEFEKTTVAMQLCAHPKRQAALVYDLRHDPTEFMELSPEQLVERWRYNREEGAPSRLPIKTLRFNCCPAVAPLGVLDAASQERLKISLDTVITNRKKLLSDKSFAQRVCSALDIMDDEQQERFASETSTVDGQLYDGGFFDEHDKQLMSAMRVAEPSKLDAQLASDLHDNRLQQLLPLYKARNFSSKLTDDERKDWEAYRFERLMAGGQNGRLGKFLQRLAELNESGKADRYLLEELQLYAESIMPIVDSDE